MAYDFSSLAMFPINVNNAHYAMADITMVFHKSVTLPQTFCPHYTLHIVGVSDYTNILCSEPS